MVGLSVLEAMTISFLLDLDDYCGKKRQRSDNTQVEIQLEANHQVNTGRCYIKRIFILTL